MSDYRMGYGVHRKETDYGLKNRPSLANLYILFVLCLILVHILGVVSIETNCTQANVDLCLETFLAENSTAAIPNNIIILTYDEPTLHSFCSQFTQMKECLKPMIPNCDKRDQLYLQGISIGYEYMCNDNMNEYLTFQPCLVASQIDSDVLMCSRERAGHMRNLTLARLSQSELVENICNFTENYIYCVHMHVKKKCGESAAIWMKKMYEHSVNATITSLNCNFTATYEERNDTIQGPDNGVVREDDDDDVDGDESESIINSLYLADILIPTVTILILVPLLIVCIVCHHKRKKVKDSFIITQESQYENHNELPSASEFSAMNPMFETSPNSENNELHTDKNTAEH